MRFCLAFGLSLFALAPAQAQPAAKPILRSEFLTIMDQEFRKMDADRDGKLTRKEADQFQRAVAVAEAGQRNRTLFAQLDADRNGQVSQAEFLKLSVPAPTDTAPMFRQYDPNHDGIITIVENRAVKLSRFDAIDADKDGVASLAEQRSAGLIK